MLSRLLDPRDGTPRNPVFWLVVSAIAATQLLAFYVLCTEQVRNAQHRRVAVQVQQVAHNDCVPHLASSTAASCSGAFVPGARRSSVAGDAPPNNLLR